MEDCFANKNGGCSALHNKQCRGCSFYKTQKEFLQAQKNALEYLMKLDKTRRNQIDAEYYGGKMIEVYKRVVNALSDMGA